MKKTLLFLIVALVFVFFVSCVEEIPDDDAGKLPEEPNAPAHVHDFSIFGNDDFLHWCKCSECDEFKYNDSHDYEDKVITEPTYTEDGAGEQRCKVCNHVNEYIIPMSAHECDPKIVNENEAECGDYYYYECEICGYGYESEEKKEHEFVDYECKLCQVKYISDGVIFTVDDEEKFVRASGTVNEDVLVFSYNVPKGYDFIAGPFYGDFSEVIFPKNLTKFDPLAFSSCQNLKELEIPESVKEIGSFSSYVEKLTLHSKLKSKTEGKNYFYNDVIYFNGSVKELVAFLKTDAVLRPDKLYVKESGSYKLLEKIDYTGDYIPSEAFADIDSIKEVKLNVKYLPDEAFKNLANLESVEIKATEIGDKCFYNCPKLTEISLSVEKLGDSTFSHCDALKSVTLSEETVYVGAYAFSNCRALEYFDSSTGEFIFFGNGVLSDTESLTDLHIRKNNCSGVYVTESVKNLTIPYLSESVSVSRNNQVTDVKITNFTNDYYSYLEEQTFPMLESLDLFCYGGEVPSISNFENLQSLKINSNTPYVLVVRDLPKLSEIKIENASVIDSVSGCPNLKSFSVPEGTIHILVAAFNSTGLTEIYLPSSIRFLQGDAFPETLEKVYYSSDLLDWSSKISMYEPNANPMYYASEFYTLKDGEYILPTTLDYPLEFGIYDGKINDYAFYGFTQLTDIEPQIMSTEIGKYAFAKSGISTFANTLSGAPIGEYAFYECENLATINLMRPSFIGDYAFALCENLKNISITLNSSTYDYSEFGIDVFEGCEPYTESYEGGEYIGNSINPYAVLFGGNYTEVHQNCEYIYPTYEYRHHAFSDGTLWTVYENVTYYGDNINPYATAMYVVDNTQTSYTLHPDTEVISSYLFAGNTNLEHLDMPIGLKLIEREAFKNCINLTTITFEKNIQTIKSDAFKGCNSLSYVTIKCSDLDEFGNIWFNIDFGNEYSTPMSYAHTLRPFFNETVSLSTDVITIPDGITVLKPYSLYNFNSSYRVLKIPASVKEIDIFAVMNNNFTKIDFAGKLDDWINLNCTSFFTVGVIDGVPVSKTELFIDGKELTTLELTKDYGDVIINSHLFATSSLESLTINTKSYIHSDAFYGASGIKELKIYNNYAPVNRTYLHFYNLYLNYFYVEDQLNLFLVDCTIEEAVLKDVIHLGFNNDFNNCSINELIIDTTSICITEIGRNVESIKIKADSVALDKTLNAPSLKSLVIEAKNLVYIYSLYAENLITVDMSCIHYEGVDFSDNERYEKLENLSIKEPPKEES